MPDRLGFVFGALLLAISMGGCTLRATLAPEQLKMITESCRAPTGETGEERAAPCAPDLTGCPDTGCADPTQSPEHALANQTKRQSPDGVTFETAQPVSVDDLIALQGATEDLIGAPSPTNELDASVRGHLRQITVHHKSLGEGTAVRIDGFIVGVPHANSGESVNCRLTAQKNNDFHVNFASHTTSDSPDSVSQYGGLVAEMVPQGRSSHAGWTLAALRELAQTKQRVMFVGRLFYDNYHFVNSDQTAPLPGQPPRATLWEVHPIAEVYVCADANGKCSATSLDHWEKLE